MQLEAITLEDKFDAEEGRVFINGPQAIARILIDQKRRDRAAGLNTAGFISGYRGSPLGNVDSALWQARKVLAAHDVRFQPGVNEELAATAIYGSQQADFFGRSKYDGVFAAWYGKGPGVDRAGDALKHGNLAGTARHGGVLVFAGDDHSGKSSTTCHQSEQALVAAMIPILYPASVAEFLSFGRSGYALSRASGLWVGFKCVNDTADASATAPLIDPRAPFILPSDAEHDSARLSIIAGESRWDQERRTVEQRLPAAQAFALANGIDRVISKPRPAGIGIVTAGKAYLDVMEALQALGLDAKSASDAGIGVLKLGMTWPLEPRVVSEFCAGLREVLVVEEKRAFIEPQLKDVLFHAPEVRRPVITGKFDLEGRPLLPAVNELSATVVLNALAARLAALDMLHGQPADCLAALRRNAPTGAASALTDLVRTPFFCSGCPHNSSTQVPQGSVALAGIGCHVMAAFMPHRKHTWPVQMGGEGANWVGAAAFSDTTHVFQNLGDGTYYHSGLLAIRQAIIAGVNITYKILYNDAVAMTGGQPVEGGLSVAQIVAELQQEGVRRIHVVADDVQRYEPKNTLPNGVVARPREELEQVQQDLARTPGVTVLIYDQVCAAEKRRRRKRKLLDDPPTRVFINERVCEGCGDCGVQSNCVSVQPLETEFGRKRVIDQSSCNKDMSCRTGFCPSFVTVHGGELRASAAQDAKRLVIPDLPAPRPLSSDAPRNILVTGIGGTGVITVGAVIGMAAHLDGLACSVLDMTGLSQKNGAVFSHLKIGAGLNDIHAPRIRDSSADLLLACDLIVASGAEAQAACATGVTAGVVNTHVSSTAAFTFTPDLDLQSDRLRRDLKARLNVDHTVYVDATRIAVELLGDSIAANMIVVGAAAQRGLLPVSLAALERAVRLNAVAVAMNLKALAIGRWLAVDAPAVLAQLKIERRTATTSLDELMQHRIELLTAYQDRAYAVQFEAFVSRVRDAENVRVPGQDLLARTVARYLYKLMAYKDEYEVARLYTDGEFAAGLRKQFAGSFRLSFHLAPPGIAPRDANTGKPRKLTFGPWVLQLFKALAACRRLRGTPFDPFGYSMERRMERRLITEYRAIVDELLGSLSAERQSLAVEIATYPEHIRGYGHIKKRQIHEAIAKRDERLTRWRSNGSNRASP